MSNASIAICLCTFNGQVHLEPLLESLAAQRRLPTVLVVGDDGSTDATLSIVRDFARSAPFPVDLRVRPGRLGPFANLEELLATTDGDVLFPCDQDDVWRPEKLERMVEELEASGAGAVICNSSLIGGDDRAMKGSLFEHVGLDASLRSELLEGRAMPRVARRNVVASHALGLSRTALNFVLPFGPPGHGDWWIGLVLSGTTGIAVVDEPLVAYRLHRGNTVGLVERVDVAERVVASTASRFVNRADLVDAAVARVDSLAPTRLTPADRADLVELATHLRRRGTLSSARSSRLAFVGRELLSGRYARFGNGWRSAVLDVVGQRES